LSYTHKLIAVIPQYSNIYEYSSGENVRYRCSPITVTR